MQNEKLLLDNTYLSDYTREKLENRIGPARKFAQRNATSALYLSVVTIAEFFERYGLAATRNVIAEHRTLGLHVGDAIKCGEIQTRLAAKRLGENDAWLATQAIRSGATLVTRDKRFKDVHGLSVATY